MATVMKVIQVGALQQMAIAPYRTVYEHTRLLVPIGQTLLLRTCHRKNIGPSSKKIRCKTPKDGLLSALSKLCDKMATSSLLKTRKASFRCLDKAKKRQKSKKMARKMPIKRKKVVAVRIKKADVWCFERIKFRLGVLIQTYNKMIG